MKSLAILFFVIVLSYGVGQWLNGQDKNDGFNVVEKNYTCNLVKEICEIENNITLQFQGDVSALTPFLILVKVGSVQPENIKLVFEMEGMEMGFNKYNLIKKLNNWQIETILPICSLGRNDWMLSVEMTFADVTKISKFKFSQLAE